ncbi:hypothetical protein [Streptomyces erythrochromogenes]|uniref:hypothetical protein n=1 Tax=Streptomyces erythrochromogenes TaxID=285574 RepID=UPI00381BF938
MDGPRASWANTTHDWAGAVDAEHLAHIRCRPAEFAPDGPWHLALTAPAAVDLARLAAAWPHLEVRVDDRRRG